jgi:HEPN domain-containing protein
MIKCARRNAFDKDKLDNLNPSETYIFSELKNTKHSRRFILQRGFSLRRTQDWMRQAKKDLSHAEKSLAGGDYEWSCFSAQQAAEKGVKALFQHLGADAFGHSVSMLLKKLPKEHSPPETLIDLAKTLDRHYIVARYPNVHPGGAPLDFYTKKDAEEAVKNAREIIKFCEDHVRASKGNG